MRSFGEDQRSVHRHEALTPRTRVENLSRSWQSAPGTGDGFDPVAETSEFADHLCGAALGARFGHRWPTLLVYDAVVEELPDQPTETVRDGADCLCMSESDDEAPIHEFKDTAFGLDRGVCSLIEEAAHLPIPVRRSATMVDAGALLVARARPDPGGEAFR